jgi:ubiquitin-like 1-activating enzyme E1 A
VEAAAPRIQALNPRVKVTSETDMKLLDREDYISAFDLIVLTEPSAAYLVSPSLEESRMRLMWAVQRKFDEVTRRCGVKMIAAASVGIDGWMFTDLLEHEFMVYVSPSPSSSVLRLMGFLELVGTRSRRLDREK